MSERGAGQASGCERAWPSRLPAVYVLQSCHGFHSAMLSTLAGGSGAAKRPGRRPSRRSPTGPRDKQLCLFCFGYGQCAAVVGRHRRRRCHPLGRPHPHCGRALAKCS